MGTFVTDPSEMLFDDKERAPDIARRPNWTNNNVLRHEEINGLRDAVYDLRTAHLALASSVTTDEAAALDARLVTSAGSSTARTLANRFAEFRNIKDFGAVGDGVANDAPAIRAALTALQADGGGTLVFTPGTYLLNSYGYVFDTLDFVALIPSNVRLLGVPGAKLKVANGFIDSSTNTQKGSLFISINAHDITFENLEIDFNGANNLATQAPWCSYGYYAVNTDRITVRKCYWHDTPGLNYVIAYGVAASNTPAATGFTVEDCWFRNGGTSLVGNTLQNDFSAIYTTNFGSRVMRNRISHDSRPWTYCGGIELHASDSQATHNIVEDSYPAIYLGQTPGSTIERITVSQNDFKNCHAGVYFPEFTTVAYKNISITNNICTLLRLAALTPATSYICDFVLEAVPSYGGTVSWADYPFTVYGVTIANNTVESLNGTEVDGLTYGIELSSVDGANITGNTFRGLSGAPLWLRGSPYGTKHVRFSDNVCVDFGNHSHVSNPRFGVGLALLGASSSPVAAAYSADDVVIENNTFAITTAATHTSAVYSDFDSGTTLTGWVCRNNKYKNIGALARGSNPEKTPVESTVRDFGAMGDGVTDDSAAIQACIDANKGGTARVAPAGGTYYCAGILLSGSTYNKTALVGEGGWLKFKADAGAGNFPVSSPVLWSQIVVHNCDGVTVRDLWFDGNRSSMTATQHMYCLLGAGATGFDVINPKFYEVRGDGMALTSANPTVSSAPCKNVKISNLYAYNSSDDGRNALSVISCEFLTIEGFHSYQVGGVIGGSRMPGGLDIEPDAGRQAWQYVQYVNATGIHVVTSGAGGIQVVGQEGTPGARNYNCYSIRIKGKLIRTGRAADAASGSLAASNFIRCTLVDVDVEAEYYFERGGGWLFDYCDYISGRARGSYCATAIAVGVLETVNNINLEVNISDCTVSGLRVGTINTGRFTGEIASLSDASAVGVLLSQDAGAAAQADVTYAVDIVHDVATTIPAYAFQNNSFAPTTFDADTVITNCSLKNFPFNRLRDGAATAPKLVNVSGIESSSMPAAGRWVAGEYVPNTSPAVSGGEVVSGWRRVTSGTSNTLGTDWVADYAGTHNTGDVTIGTANGLSLSGQALSLATAVAGVSAGAVSASDQTKLNNTSGTNSGDVTIGTANGLSLSGQALSLAVATDSVPGAMSAADHTKLSGVTTGATAGVTTMAAVGASPNSNGASISTTTLTLQPADGTNPGVVTTGAQTIAGVKTLSSTPSVPGLTMSATGAANTITSATTATGGTDTAFVMNALADIDTSSSHTDAILELQRNNGTASYRFLGSGRIKVNAGVNNGQPGFLFQTPSGGEMTFRAAGGSGELIQLFGNSVTSSVEIGGNNGSNPTTKIGPALTEVQVSSNTVTFGSGATVKHNTTNVLKASAVAIAAAAAVPGTLNLSTQGIIDWLTLGGAGSNPPYASITHRKKNGEWDMASSFGWFGTGVSGLATFTSTSSCTVSTNATDEAFFGTAALSSATDVGVFPSGTPTGYGFAFCAAATPTTRTLKIYLGVFKGTGTLTCTLPDGTTASQTVNSPAGDVAENYALFTVTYNSLTYGQFLQVKFELTTNNAASANVKFIGATLA